MGFTTMRSKLIAAFALAAGLALMAQPASAAVVNCSAGAPDVSGNVTPNAGCQFSNSATNDAPPPPPAVVNAEMFFGFSDWLFDGKDNGVDGVDEGPNTLGLVLTGDTKSGTWALTGLSSLAGIQVMLIFKDGVGSLPSPLIGYLLDGLSGTYTSPFFGDKGQVKDISHVSIYYRVSEVPLPGALWLMGAGLAGLGFASRKKKA